MGNQVQIQSDWISEAESRKAMRVAILAACFGGIPALLVNSSSIFILYATMLNSSRFVSLCTTALDSLAVFLFYMPLAYLMHRYGKKKLVIPAFIAGGIGLGLTAFAPFFGHFAEMILLAGLTVFSITTAFHIAAWFALLKDVVPETQRGRFFGHMRTAWQVVVCIFLFVSTAIMRFSSSMLTFQIIILVASTGFFIRAWYTHKIPEREPQKDGISFVKSLRLIFRNQRLLGFGTYLFWLYMFSGSVVPVAILMAKLVLKMNDDFLVLLSSCLMIGNIVGFFLGGHVVDRRGTKKVFLLTHFSFGILSLMLLFVQGDSLVNEILLLVFVTLYGLVYSAASIAVSSETFAIVPDSSSEMGIAACLGMYYAGLGLSRFVVGWILDSGMLSNSWVLFGRLQLTQYHTLFLISGFGVIVTCVLLVMIPSVVGKSRLIPEIR